MSNYQYIESINLIQGEQLTAAMFSKSEPAGGHHQQCPQMQYNQGPTRTQVYGQSAGI